MNTLRIKLTSEKLKLWRKPSKLEGKSRSSSETDTDGFETPTPKTEKVNTIVDQGKPNLSTAERLGVQRVGGEHARARDATGIDNKSEDEEERNGGTLHAATSAALTRFRGIATTSTRSGTSGKAMVQRPVSWGKGAAQIAAATSQDKSTDSESNENSDSTGSRGTPRESRSVRNTNANDRRTRAPLILKRKPERTKARRSSMEAWETGIAALFDDSDEEDAGGDQEELGSSIKLDQEKQEYAATARSNWASTLRASTIARRISMGKTPSGGCPYMLPNLASNEVKGTLQSITHVFAQY